MPATPAFIAAIGIGAASSAYQARQMRKAQERAMDQARREAARPGPQAAKSPTRIGAGTLPQPGSASGTLLTGPSGVAGSSLNLGRNTLLGE